MKKIKKVSSFFTKKRSTLIIFLLLSIFIIPKNTYALDFTVNDTTYTVDSDSKLVDYCYFYFKNNNVLGDYFLVDNHSGSLYSYRCFTWSVGNNIVCSSNNMYTQETLGQSQAQFKSDYTFYTNTVTNKLQFYYADTFVSSNFSHTCTYNNVEHTITKNIDYDEIECRYNTCDCSTNNCSSGNDGEECGPVEIINFPISNTEFVALLIFLGVLICMLFFKWCFPMKGGKKL